MNFRILGCACASEITLRTFRKKLLLNAEDSSLLAEKLLAVPGMPEADLSNFRREGHRSRESVLAAVGSLYDAGIKVPDPNIFILGGGETGSFEENLLYFQNYRSSIRHAGHGHLFVATLPSTPLCEIAMALKLHGGLFYINGPKQGIRQELLSGPFPMLYVRQNRNSTNVFVLDKLNLQGELKNENHNL